MRYLGIDYGSKKVGVALSDEAGTMGFPQAVVPNTPALLEDITKRIQEERVGTVVMGESRDLSGAENPIAREAKQFAEALTGATGVPVVWEQEFFTTQAARRMPGQPDAKPDRKQRDMAPVDSSAAALILTSYLERNRA